MLVPVFKLKGFFDDLRTLKAFLKVDKPSGKMKVSF